MVTVMSIYFCGYRPSRFSPAAYVVAGVRWLKVAYLASSGTIFNSSFSVHRSTVSEQLTPTRTSVSTR